MSSNYDSLQKAKDAQAFANSRFGQHYIQRLKDLKQGALDAAMDISYTDSFRAHKATQASILDQEITYFDIAQRIQENTTLVEKVRAKLQSRKEAETKDV